ncbi:acyclic terpene utilization AtuA family protein [Pseudonocardia sp. NPDC049635]|uniref:acyclic terpene utilization AtuA family protein n=1 Tax=Pseudonocardia sp. NPDC049635 TaxID=3155506 RepID=UPI00340FB02A
MSRAVRIGNVSGFYGDRIDAAREMVDAGDVDVVCGDYLAELTMLILAKAQARDGGVGYARTFLTQVEQILAGCAERGIRIVANAGGLDPAGLAGAVRAVAAAQGVTVRVAHVEGDDLRGDLSAIVPAVEGTPVSANAYLGAWGIAEALAAGADVVVTGRVTDASLVVGPAAWWHGWAREDWDALAGAVVAGHVIECGPQATGGNYPFLDEITDRRYPGFPIAEVAADGSSVITKPEGTGGLVSVGTVTAQLLYEIGPPAYLGPDVTAHFDTIRLEQAGEHRVAIDGVRGSPPPETLKVALNDVGGYRNTMTLVLTGLEVEAKAAWAKELLFGILDRDAFDDVDVRLLRFDHPDAGSNPEATAHLRITVKGADRRLVGRTFSNATMQLALGGYAGFHTTTPPTDATAFGIYRPAAVSRDAVAHTVVLPDGTRRRVADPPVRRPAPPVAPLRGGAPSGAGAVPVPPRGAGDAPAAPRGDEQSGAGAAPAAQRAGEPGGGRTRRVPLGAVAGARSGDKGGDANIGVWARDRPGHEWLAALLTPRRVRELLGPEAADLDVTVFDLPNLHAVNVVVHGLLGDGVASSTRPDPQAKGLGEYLRSRVVDVPEHLLAE